MKIVTVKKIWWITLAIIVLMALGAPMLYRANVSHRVWKQIGLDGPGQSPITIRNSLIPIDRPNVVIDVLWELSASGNYKPEDVSCAWVTLNMLAEDTWSLATGTFYDHSDWSNALDLFLKKKELKKDRLKPVEQKYVGMLLEKRRSSRP
jgi:hypothetical protein